VVELLVATDHRPGVSRRPQIQKALRTAEVALLLMARGARPVGWAGYWRSRSQHRDYIMKARAIIDRIQQPNPLSGLREADEQLRKTIVTCMVGICRDQLGDVLVALEESAASRTSSPGKARRVSSPRRKSEQLCIVGLPMAAVLTLRHFHIVPPGLFLNALLGFAALILVVGPFVILFPGLHAFLNRLGEVITAVSAVLPMLKGETGKKSVPAQEQRPSSEPASVL
jgi:hypothetical protein